jgi:hypothetical protein
VRANLASCQVAFSKWSGEKFGQNARKLRSLTKQLERMQRKEQAEHSDYIRQIQGDIDRLLEMEDLRWKQRAKQNCPKVAGGS